MKALSGMCDDTDHQVLTRCSSSAITAQCSSRLPLSCKRASRRGLRCILLMTLMLVEALLQMSVRAAAIAVVDIAIKTGLRRTCCEARLGLNERQQLQHQQQNR